GAALAALLPAGKGSNARTAGRGESLLHLAARAGNAAAVLHLYRDPGYNNDLQDAAGTTGADAVFASGVVGALPAIIADRTGTSSKQDLAQGFVAAASQYLPDVGLGGAPAPLAFFLAAGELPHYDRCLEHHVTAEEAAAAEGGRQKRVLFLSHRWERRDFPDAEDHVQYRIACEFLRSGTAGDPASEPFDYVWADYSCICQDKGSPAFKRHLLNIPTAVFVATHVLVVPRRETDDGSGRPREGSDSEDEGALEELSYTNLDDYAGRGWCQLEALLCLITGCRAWLAFQADGTTDFVPAGEGSSVFT
ncbi:unnamed protein product, partial [Heterosigma akashiwo]